MKRIINYLNNASLVKVIALSLILIFIAFLLLVVCYVFTNGDAPMFVNYVTCQSGSGYLIKAYKLNDEFYALQFFNSYTDLTKNYVCVFAVEHKEKITFSNVENDRIDDLRFQSLGVKRKSKRGILDLLELKVRGDFIVQNDIYTQASTFKVKKTIVAN